MDRVRTIVTFMALVTVVHSWMPAALPTQNRNRREGGECYECSRQFDSSFVDRDRFGDATYFQSVCTSLMPALDCMLNLDQACNQDEVALAKFICVKSEEFAALVDCWQQQGRTVKEVLRSCDKRQSAEDEGRSGMCTYLQRVASCLQAQNEGCPVPSAKALTEASTLYLSYNGCM